MPHHGAQSARQTEPVSVGQKAWPGRTRRTYGTPEVSVVIPAYNAAATIGSTLASLRAQSFTDFECVVVDDGSTDETAARALAAIAGDPRLTVVSQPNGGVAAARNRGLAQARGRYVANLDADDLWRPHFLARTVESLSRAPAAAMSFARSVWIGPDDAPLSDPPPPLEHADYREILIRNPIGNGSAALMRRDAVVACGGWDAGLVRDFGPAEDWQLQLELAARAPVEVVDQPLVEYRITPNGASAALERSARATLEVIRRRQACGPRLDKQCYWMARSIAMLGLVRRARRSGQTRLALWLAAQAYLRNPLWFQDRALREPIVNAILKAPRLLQRLRPDERLAVGAE